MVKMEFRRLVSWTWSSYY